MKEILTQIWICLALRGDEVNVQWRLFVQLVLILRYIAKPKNKVPHHQRRWNEDREIYAFDFLNIILNFVNIFYWPRSVLYSRTTLESLELTETFGKTNAFIFISTHAITELPHQHVFESPSDHRRELIQFCEWE